jgi:hypothetical protein
VCREEINNWFIEAMVALWQPAFIKYAERIKFPDFFFFMRACCNDDRVKHAAIHNFFLFSIAFWHKRSKEE